MQTLYSFFFLLITPWFFSLSQAQTGVQVRNYTVYHTKTTIGKLNAKKYSENGTTVYDVKTNLDFTIFKSVSVRHTLLVKTKDGIVIYAYLKSVINNEIEKEQTLTWDGTQYTIKTLEGTTYLQDKIYITVAMLYFHEPTNRTRIFSENFMAYQPMTAPDVGKYELDLDDGTTTDYFYQNGSCMRMETVRMFYGVTFLLDTP
jgi:hypothetical protein